MLFMRLTTSDRVAVGRKSPYKPSIKPRVGEIHGRSRSVGKKVVAAKSYRTLTFRPPAGLRKRHHDIARQFQMLQDPQGRLQNLCLLQPCGCREKRTEGHLATAVLAEGAAREFAAQ